MSFVMFMNASKLKTFIEACDHVLAIIVHFCIGSFALVGIGLILALPAILGNQLQEKPESSPPPTLSESTFCT